MKQLLQLYAAYNLWANKIIAGKIAQLPQSIIHKDMQGSFPGIYETAAHLAEVESVWWQRLKLQEHIEYPGPTFEEDFEKVSGYWIQLSKQWYDWVSGANEVNLEHVFGYQNSKKEYFKQPVYEMLLHLFNHQTYHRGQIIVMMRQNGVDKIPATDFILFTRGKKI
jgi:uncharacterized damage-inducible protein DinB